MKFTKMEGLGNDFLVIRDGVELSSAQVAWLCDRHFGVGADGVLRVGSEAMWWSWSTGMPTAASPRCAATDSAASLATPWRTGWSAEKEFLVRTAVGERRVEASVEPRVELGPVTVGESFDWGGLRFYRASVGNPHAVAVVDDPDLIDVPRIGAALEGATTGGVNVGFVSQGPEGLRLRVWERGSGETLACGSGMVAAAAVAQRVGLISDHTTIDVPGGQARVELEPETSWLIGPARFVFSGEVEVPSL